MGSHECMVCSIHINDHLYKPVKNADADRFVREARSREQANLVPTDESGVRQIFKALKQGETTVILPDHTLMWVEIW